MNNGGEGGIRTLDKFPCTRVPGGLLKPLGHPSIFGISAEVCIVVVCNVKGAFGILEKGGNCVRLPNHLSSIFINQLQTHCHL